MISRRVRPGGPIDRTLRADGLARRVVATVPRVATALAVVAVSEAVVVLPRRLRDPLGPRLRTRPLPWKLSSETAAVSWHRRHTSDPAHAWLRDLVATTLEAALTGGHRAVAALAGGQGPATGKGGGQRPATGKRGGHGPATGKGGGQGPATGKGGGRQKPIGSPA